VAVCSTSSSLFLDLTPLWAAGVRHLASGSGRYRRPPPPEATRRFRAREASARSTVRLPITVFHLRFPPPRHRPLLTSSEPLLSLVPKNLLSQLFSPRYPSFCHGGTAFLRPAVKVSDSHSGRRLRGMVCGSKPALPCLGMSPLPHEAPSVRSCCALSCLSSAVVTFRVHFALALALRPRRRSATRRAWRRRAAPPSQPTNPA